MRRALVVLVMAAAMLVPSGVAAQDDADCVTALLSAPVETATLPDGFFWTGLSVAEGWVGSVDNGSKATTLAHVYLYCRDDAGLVMERTAEVIEALRLEDKIGAVDIADGSFATRSLDALTIELIWRHGDIMGTVSSFGWESDYSPETNAGPVEIGDLERIALAIDATLPD
jgi:hypothetical protein